MVAQGVQLYSTETLEYYKYIKNGKAFMLFGKPQERLIKIEQS